MKTIRVAAAIIIHNDRIFATQRGYGVFKDGWEFPGGKIEEGETPQEALVREIREELDTEIEVGELFDTVEYDYPAFHLSMACFFCTVKTGDLVLKEHEAARWLTRENIDSVAWLPADIELIQKLKDNWQLTAACMEGKQSYTADTVSYRRLEEKEICLELFAQFIRHQKVGKCRRKVDGQWKIVDDPFTDDWTQEEYKILVGCLKNTVLTGGFVCGAFYRGALKGFVSVEAGLFGGAHRYLDLSSIHVSEDMRGQGIGKKLFEKAVIWAKQQEADKLYISAHSAVETQAFYQSVGCVDAQWHHREHVEREPYDCQLEYRLRDKEG